MHQTCSQIWIIEQKLSLSTKSFEITVKQRSVKIAKEGDGKNWTNDLEIL